MRNRRFLCRFCGVVPASALAVAITYSTIGGSFEDRDIHVSHPEHTPEGGPYTPEPEGVYAVGSNSGGTAVAFDPLVFQNDVFQTGSRPTRVRLNWPDDLS